MATALKVLMIIGNVQFSYSCINDEALGDNETFIRRPGGGGEIKRSGICGHGGEDAGGGCGED